MIRIFPGAVLPVLHPAIDTPSKPTVHNTLLDCLEGYQASVRGSAGEPKLAVPSIQAQECSDWSEIIAILGGRRSEVGAGLYRSRRSVDGETVPLRVVPEPIARAPLTADFKLELDNAFRKSAMRAWQRADLIAKVLQEWSDEGPSEQAGKRLQKIFEPAYIDTPEEPRGAVIIDAIMLHLIDRGRYPALVKDYVDSLKRSGDYENIVDALHSSYPEKSRDWAKDTANRLLNTWDQFPPANSELGGDDSFIPPSVDMDCKLKKFYQLMNPDLRMSQDDSSSIEYQDTEGTA